jgi:hypothetical protein
MVNNRKEGKFARPVGTRTMRPSEEHSGGNSSRTYQILLKPVTSLASLLFSYRHLTRSARISHRTRLPALAPPSHTACACVTPPHVTGDRCPSSLYPFITQCVPSSPGITFLERPPLPRIGTVPPTFAPLVPRRILPLSLYPSPLRTYLPQTLP